MEVRGRRDVKKEGRRSGGRARGYCVRDSRCG